MSPPSLDLVTDLINRFRLHAAQEKSETSTISRTVGLLLAERDNESGETAYGASNLNPFLRPRHVAGRFLGLGVTDAQQLLEAGLEKKHREANHYRLNQHRPFTNASATAL
jgi:hypothetical protein